MEKTYIIIYQLGAKSNESAIIDFIKSFKSWARITDSSWAVVTETKASEIRDSIKNHTGAEGRVFVVKSGIESAWNNTRAKNQWFKDNM